MRTLLKIFLFCLCATQLNAQANSSRDSSSLLVPFKTPPAFTYQPNLEFPSFAREAGVDGSILVKVAIGKDGKPYKTEILKREPEFVYIFMESQ